MDQYQEYSFLFILSKYSDLCKDVEESFSRFGINSILKDIKILYCDKLYIKQIIKNSNYNINTVPCVLEINKKTREIQKYEDDNFIKWFDKVIELSIRNDEYIKSLENRVGELEKEIEENRNSFQKKEIEENKPNLYEEEPVVNKDWVPQSMRNPPNSIIPKQENVTYDQNYNSFIIGSSEEENEEESYAGEVYSIQDRKISIDNSSNYKKAHVQDIQNRNTPAKTNKIDVMKIAAEIEKEREKETNS